MVRKELCHGDENRCIAEEAFDILSVPRSAEKFQDPTKQHIPCVLKAYSVLAMCAAGPELFVQMAIHKGKSRFLVEELYLVPGERNSPIRLKPQRDPFGSVLASEEDE